MAKVTDKQLDHLREHGYVVVRGFLTPTEVKAARRAVFTYVPSPEEWLRAPRKFQAITDEESLHKIEFPYAEKTLNDMATHERIIDFVERLYGHDDVMLARSAVWAKYAGTSNYDQEMHADFEGNTLVTPRDDSDYRQVNIILYYSDVDETLGPTMVVPRKFGDPMGLQPPRRFRDEYPEAYEHEQPVLAKAGDMLIFSMRSQHRGSPITLEGGTRYTHHLVYRSARHNFQGHRCWPSFGEYPEMQQFIETATVRQRDVVGFPRVGDPYWNEQTIREVGVRYPRMDLKAYVKGMKKRK
jgi:hypothetical protein